jgi:hypothetical protein
MAKAGRKSTLLFDFRGRRGGATIRGRPVLFEPPDRLDLLEEELRELQSRLKSGGPPAPPVRKLSGKEWVPTAFDRRRDELLAMGTITKASDALAEESWTAADCAKQPLQARYIEKLLRELGVFPKANRNPPRQRPK